MTRILKPWFFILIVSIGLIAATTFYGGKRKGNEQNIVKLPAEAVVKKVEPGDWGSDGRVTFTLPTNHPVSSWLDTVWSMNPSKEQLDSHSRVPDGFDSGPYARTAFYGGAAAALKYDPLERTYEYSFFGD